MDETRPYPLLGPTGRVVHQGPVGGSVEVAALLRQMPIASAIEVGMAMRGFFGPGYKFGRFLAQYKLKQEEFRRAQAAKKAAQG